MLSPRCIRIHAPHRVKTVVNVPPVAHVLIVQNARIALVVKAAQTARAAKARIKKNAHAAVAVREVDVEIAVSVAQAVIAMKTHLFAKITLQKHRRQLLQSPKVHILKPFRC
ncbi:MAG: hypothetical protein RL015_1686 [Verrucomicrobiota bacterium]|jgi:hypothetical protein